jgi:hypothetical protein
MGTKEKLEHIKEILGTCFLTATERSLSLGLQYKYNSYSCEDISFGKAKEPVKGWVIDIIVKEMGYGETTVQQFLYQWPNNIDYKNVEYHATLDVLSNITQSGLIFWYETGKHLNTNKEAQKIIKDGN